MKVVEIFFELMNKAVGLKSEFSLFGCSEETGVFSSGLLLSYSGKQVVITVEM